MHWRGVWVCLLWGAVGCAGTQASGEVESKLDRHDPRRLYPLAEGTVWSYDVDTGEGVPTLAITRGLAVDGSRAQVSSGGDPVTYDVRDGGLYRLGRGGWLLKAPVREGAQWDAGGGVTASVVGAEHHVSTEAGEFRGCLTVEESGGPSGMRVRTTYCPDVGPVRVESALVQSVSGAQAQVKAELRGYALHGL